MKYDYLVVGAGLFGSTFAYEANKKGKKVIVVDRRNHIGGNTFCEKIQDINVHKYGAHIFHTNNKTLWDYVNGFARFNRFINSPIANYKGEIYNLPFNMNTFNKLWGVIKPQDAYAIIENQRAAGIKNPKNLEEQAISIVGKDIYNKLIKGYTEKQWGRNACDLPSSIINRIPVRFTYDNNYFNDKYQGIPEGGYNEIIIKMLKNIDIELNTDFNKYRNYLTSISSKIVYTGMIDEFYTYTYGNLQYRSLRFENEILETENYQGNAVVNYTDRETPFTRIIEHKHFEFGTQKNTIITREYPMEWSPGDEPYYPINDDKNNILYNKYKQLAKKETNIIFGGRLADYKYYDMHQVIENALKETKKEFHS